MMKHPKLIVVVILVILTAVVFYQNSETIETRILFFTVRMSRAAALSLSFLAGLVTGGTVVGFMGKRRSASASASAKEE